MRESQELDAAARVVQPKDSGAGGGDGKGVVGCVERHCRDGGCERQFAKLARTTDGGQVVDEDGVVLPCGGQQGGVEAERDVEAVEWPGDSGELGVEGELRVARSAFTACGR
jgi:hypothetical protein